MSAQQYPLYRALELLHKWYLPIGNKMPKLEALQNLGREFQRNLLEATTACAVAIKTPPNQPQSRLELMDMMAWHLDICKTTINLLYEFSSQKGQTIRVVSELQYENFIEKMKDIQDQLSGWRKKTASSMK